MARASFTTPAPIATLRAPISRASATARAGASAGATTPRKRPATASSSRAKREASSARWAVEVTGTALEAGADGGARSSRAGLQRGLHRRDDLVQLGHGYPGGACSASRRRHRRGRGRGKSRNFVQLPNGGGIRRR